MTQDSLTRCCLGCDGPSAALRCSKCKAARYCSKACLETHWPQHKSVCKSARSNDDYAVGMESALTKFGDRNMPLLSRYAYYILYLKNDPNNTKTHFIHVELMYKDGKKRSARRFKDIGFLAKPKTALEGMDHNKDLMEAIRKTSEEDDMVLMVLTAMDLAQLKGEIKSGKSEDDWDVRNQTVFMICSGVIASEGPMASSRRYKALPLMIKKLVGIEKPRAGTILYN